MLPARKPTTGCGSCSLCCYLMAVPDLNKPACVWCQHAERPHGGCRVYDTDEKPQACSDFACLWLVSQSRAREERFAYGLRPDRCRVMFHDARNEDEPNTLYVHVDPAHPGAWRWEPILNHINAVISRGCKVHVIIGWRRIVLELGKEPVMRDDGAAARTALRAVN
jgi:uncharacterized protein